MRESSKRMLQMTDQLHGEVVQPVAHVDVVGARHVGVGDLARELDLAAEPLHDLLVLGHQRSQHLERHHLAQHHVVGGVDGAHAALADLPPHEVAPVEL
jgi:hypothetical protein